MLENIKNYLLNRSKLWKNLMIISIVLFMAVLVTLVWLFLRRPALPDDLVGMTAKNSGNPALASGVNQCPNCVRRAIDGVYVEPQAANLIPLAVMIDNHPDARPPSGLEDANLVYEAEVEGYYTRLMAVFASDDKIAKIGPIRSARPYFVDWADELGAVYGHCGGSPEALVDIEQKGLTDFNEFYSGRYFWRSTDRVAPHNIYTSSDNYQSFLTAENVATSTYASWQYKADSPISNPSSTDEISINYQVPEFRVKWVYDKTDNDYVRYYSDQPQLTADKNLLAAKNVVIEIVPATVIDADLRLAMQDVGAGDATICLDGACQKGHWEKQSSAARTKLTYLSGEEVKFNAGPTWVEVMRPN